MDVKTATSATAIPAATVTKVDVVQQPRAFNFFGHNSHLLLTFSAMMLIQGSVRFVQGTSGAIYENENWTNNGDRFHWDVLAVGGAFQVVAAVFGMALAAAGIFGYLVNRGAAIATMIASGLFGLFAIIVFDFYYPGWTTKYYGDRILPVDDRDWWTGVSASSMLTAFGYDILLLGGQLFFTFAVACALRGDVFRSGVYRRVGLVASILTTWTGFWLIVMSAITVHKVGAGVNVNLAPLTVPPTYITYAGITLWIATQMFVLGVMGIIITAMEHRSREDSTTLYIYPFLMFFNAICQLVFMVYHPLIDTSFLFPTAASVVLILALNFLPAYMAILERRTAAQTYFFEQIEKTKVVTA